MNIPRDLEKDLFNLTREQWEIEAERIMNRSLHFYNEKIEKNEDLKKLINDKIKKQQSEEQQQPNSNFLIDKANYYIDKRKSEIQKLLNQEYILTKDSANSLQCEAKLLNLLDFYKDLKGKIIKRIEKQQPNIKHFDRILLDRSFYKKEKPQRKSQNTDKFEFNIRQEKEKRKRQKHQEFLKQLFIHQAEFFEFHKKVKKQSRKRANGSKLKLEQIDKSKLEQNDKKSKERLRLLKEKDLDAYMILVQETKNTKIIELLKQTDNFLRQLGGKVLVQKGEKQDEQTDEDLNFGQQSENYAQNLMRSNKVYYNLTHTIKEKIEKQPSLLDGGKLKSYQLTGLEWMMSLYNNKLNGVLADEMGLGKTIQTIALFCYLIETKKVLGPFLIVVPLSTMSNWQLEFDKWAPSVKYIPYKGSPQVRKDISKSMKTSKWHVCLTTYDYILKDRLTLHKWDWKYIIVDEGHRMKNSRSKFAYVLGQQYTSQYRILLTGTPLQNNLAELWSLLNFLLPKVFSSCEDFEKWFSMPLGKFGNTQEAVLSEEEQLLIINRLHQVLRPFLLRRVKKEVESELPNKVEYVIKVELSAWQKLVYSQIKMRSSLVYDPQSGKSQKALMNLMMQLRKICNHPYLFLDYDTSNTTDEIWRSAGKFELLDRILPKLIQTRHRMLIFTQFTQLLDIMQQYFDYRNISYLRLDGATKDVDRGIRMKLFNEQGSKYDIFMLSTRAGGLGLNLQTADTVIIFDSDWNPQQDLQAQDRAHRIGQQNEVRVFRLVTNTPIEEEILSKAAYKMGLDEKIIQAGLFNQRSTDMDRQQKLEELLKKRHQYDEQDDEIPDDEQINEYLARTEEELELFQKFDQERYEQEKQIYSKFVYPPKEQDQKQYNYRLIDDEDIPKWIKATREDVVDKKEYGRGTRMRKDVMYSDDISDNQFMKYLEDGKNPNEIQEAKRGRPKKNRQGRRSQRKAGGNQMELEDGEEDDQNGSGDEDEEELSKISEDENDDDDDDEEYNAKQKRTSTRTKEKPSEADYKYKEGNKSNGDEKEEEDDDDKDYFSKKKPGSKNSRKGQDLEAHEKGYRRLKKVKNNETYSSSSSQDKIDGSDDEKIFQESGDKEQNQK